MPSVEKWVSIAKDKLPNILFKQEELSLEERIYLWVFVAHLILTYKEDSPDYQIEFPPDISHLNRMIIHHTADRLGLGSFTRGVKSKNKKIVIGLMDMNKDKFVKAKRNRDVIVANDVKTHSKTDNNSLEARTEREVYEWTDSQIANRTKGLSFAQSWQIVLDEHKERTDEEEKRPHFDVNDGKDWSLSTSDFKLYIAGENKEVVNRLPEEEIPQQVDPQNSQKETEQEDDKEETWNENDGDSSK